MNSQLLIFEKTPPAGSHSSLNECCRSDTIGCKAPEAYGAREEISMHRPLAPPPPTPRYPSCTSVSFILLLNQTDERKMVFSCVFAILIQLIYSCAALLHILFSFSVLHCRTDYCSTAQRSWTARCSLPLLSLCC